MNNKIKIKRSFLIALSILSLTYCGVMIKGSVVRYNLYEQEGDLAAYDNTIYNTSHGRWFESTVSGSVMRFWPAVAKAKPPYESVPDQFSELGIHANWILALTNAPVTAVFDSPVTTLVLQTLFIALTGFLFGLVFFEWGLTPLASLLYVAGFFLHPAVIGANFNAFHPIVVAAPFIPLFILGLEWNRVLILVLSSVMICLSQENAILTAVFLSLLPALKKRYRLAIVHFIATVGFFVFTTKMVIPFFNENGTLPYGGLYGSPLGGSMEQIISNGLLHPGLLFETVFAGDKVKYLLNMMIGFSTLLFAPFYLAIGLVGLMPNLLSNNKAMLLFWGQYSIMGFPLFVLGGAAGFSHLKQKHFRGLGQWSIVIPLLAPLYSISIYVFQDGGKSIWSVAEHVGIAGPVSSCAVSTHCGYSEEVVKRIPSDSNISVSAPERLLSHLSHRNRAYFFPVEMLSADIDVVEKKSPWWPEEKTQAFVQQMVERGYVQTFENEEFKIYEKKMPR